MVYLTDLALNDYRNYSDQTVRFAPGVTILVGRNGQGKTNLIEAIAYLATFSSHRVSADAALVRAGAPGAVVRAKVVEKTRERVIELEIIAGKANRAKLNRTPVRTKDILGIVRTVVFAPEDLALVKGDPAVRRQFLDELGIMRMPRYADIKVRYEKVVRQRSALLKAGRRDELDVWDDQLASLGAEITAVRTQLVSELEPHIAHAYALLADGEAAGARLATSLEAAEERDGVEAQNDPIEVRLRSALQRARSRELDRGVCLVGPHRDELVLAIGDLPARGYASHGESWSLALAMRLASFRLLSDDDPPILVLDDVFAELDTRRRQSLVEVMSQAEQVLVTVAVEADVPEELAGRSMRIEGGKIVEVSDD